MIDVILSSIRQKRVDPNGFLEIPASRIISLVSMEYAFKPNERERVSVEIKRDQDFIVRCNDTLLTYIFFNLLRNSLHYTKTHRDLSITITTAVGSDNFNRIYFRDNGPGVAEDEIGHLFEAFSTFKKDNGTGLGLAFCKRTMKSFGGDISCRSEEGKFAEFVLSFPKISEDGSAKIAINNILLVDDEKTTLLITKKLLEKYLESTYCELAADAFEAIEKAKNNKYDLFLIDIEMPEIDGILASKKIREFDTKTPIVAYSTRNIQSTEHVKECGFDDYINKQIPDNFLLKTVAKWGMIGLKESLLEESRIKVLLENKTIMIVDDEGANLMLTSKYLKKYHVTTDEVSDGVHALDRLKDRKHDIILMDIEMHEMDGIAATKQIREFEAKNNLKRTPIIAITGNDNKEQIRKILNSGFNDYFIKGRDYKELTETMAFWIENLENNHRRQL